MKSIPSEVVILKDRIPDSYLTKLFTAAFLLLVIMLSWVALERIESQTKVNIHESLQTVLQTTQESLHIWVNHRKEFMADLVVQPELIDLTQKLLTESQQNKSLKQSEALFALRKHMEPVLAKHQDKGFFIISKDRLNIASMRDSNLGTINLIHEQRKEYLDATFDGHALFIPTIRSDVPLTTSSGQLRSQLPTIFVTAPVRDSSGDVMAVLALRIDPALQFTRLTQLGRIGETGETYAFDDQGVLITESRFDHHLRRVGLVSARGKGILSVRITDPGGNLLEGYIPKVSSGERPLTLMARSATAGYTGYMTEPYRDYRGVSVFGVWLWDELLGIGLATEIDVDEAMQPFYQTRLILLSVLVITVILSIALLALVTSLQRSFQKELQIAHARLEQEVEERTKELCDAKDKLELANQDLEVLAITDGVTGLSNRRNFNHHLEEEWRRCAREHHPLSLLIFDIDYFKGYNDTYGHLLGDECLIKIADFLKESDVAKRPGDLVARYGGEEFVVVLSDAAHDYAEQVAEKIRTGIVGLKMFHKASRVEGIEYVSVSVGVATETDVNQSDAKTLIRKADQALYRAKSEGRNKVSIYGQENEPNITEFPRNKKGPH